MIDNRLKEYYEDACEILNHLNIEFGPIKDMIVNSRAKSRWGQCRYNRKTKEFTIEISSMLLNEEVSYRDVMDTVIHELLHCHTDRLSHTGEWKSCANLVNAKYGYNIKRATSAEEKNIKVKRTKPKYVVICNSCNTVSMYRRKSKVVKLLMANPNNSCRCSVCNGQSFTLKQLEYDEKGECELI